MVLYNTILKKTIYLYITVSWNHFHGIRFLNFSFLTAAWVIFQTFYSGFPVSAAWVFAAFPFVSFPSVYTFRLFLLQRRIFVPAF
jgi:hypothetical protein